MDSMIYSIFLEITDKLRAEQVEIMRAAKLSVQLAAVPELEPAVIEFPPEDPSVEEARSKFGKWLQALRIDRRERRADRYAYKQQRRLDRYRLRAARRAEITAIENAARVADVTARTESFDVAIRIVSDIFATFDAPSVAPPTPEQPKPIATTRADKPNVMDIG